ncbi:divergent polysaccharide deacetylase family protein [Terasakiella sp. SH-1]|uniref:divergent polysaccharide deacetylase family protein n=1 Tax=Terasakiella sp. SH-1 TaxID=2560057 RepID=UPI0010742E2B|nr:divergent polysaccharide deacetylase family protein [Terasakiella sp. SH-1]
MADDLDDTLDDVDLDDTPSGASGVPSPTDFPDDDDFDFDDDFDYDDEGGKKKFDFKALLADKKKLAIFGGAAVVLLAAIGGGTYWLMSGDEGAEETAEATGGAKTSGGIGGAVGLALQTTATSGLTPQSKLTAGGATGGAKLTADGGAKLTAGGGTRLSAGGAAMVASQVGGGMGGYDPKNTANPLSTAAVGDVGINIPAVLPSSVSGFGAPKQAQPPAQAVDKNLMEVTKDGLVPAVAKDGREPWKSYARPFQGNASEPMVGLVVTGLGLSDSLTEAAIDHLPHDVTLAFSAYGRGIKKWVEKARAMGHEVLLELPMESGSFPADDPGPLAMMTSKTAGENLKLLNLMMATAQGYVGFIGQYGSKFMRSQKAMSPIMGELKTRGLFFMDPRSTDGSVALEMADEMQMARAISDTNINSNASVKRIRAQLDTAATVAKNRGASAAVIRITPNSLKTIREWAAGLQGVKIAPMTSLAGRQGT